MISKGSKVDVRSVWVIKPWMWGRIALPQREQLALTCIAQSRLPAPLGNLCNDPQSASEGLSLPPHLIICYKDGAGLRRRRNKTKRSHAPHLKCIFFFFNSDHWLYPWKPQWSRDFFFFSKVSIFFVLIRGLRFILRNPKIENITSEFTFAAYLPIKQPECKQ